MAANDNCAPDHGGVVSPANDNCATPSEPGLAGVLLEAAQAQAAAQLALPELAPARLSAAGRPAGRENNSTRQLRAYLREHNAMPTLRLAQVVGLGTDWREVVQDLAKFLGCDRAAAFDRFIKVVGMVQDRAEPALKAVELRDEDGVMQGAAAAGLLHLAALRQALEAEAMLAPANDNQPIDGLAEELMRDAG
jgi:hypothetical protein